MKRRSTPLVDPGWLTPSGLSTRQVAAVLVAICLAVVLMPLGASAGNALTKVLISDPTNTAQLAKVDAAGNLQVGGTVSVGNTPSVNVANSPTVAALQSGTWNVGITGSPSVSIANTPAVTSSDTNVVIAHGSVTLSFLDIKDLFSDLDVSAYKDVRLSVSTSGFSAGQLGFTVETFTPDNADITIDSFSNSLGTDTKVYEVLAPNLTVKVTDSSVTTGTVFFELTGRSN